MWYIQYHVIKSNNAYIIIHAYAQFYYTNITIYYISLPKEWREWPYKFSLSRGLDTYPLLVMVALGGGS